MSTAVHPAEGLHYRTKALSRVQRHRKQDGERFRTRTLELAYDGLNETVGRLDLPADARLRLWQIRGDLECLLSQEGILGS
jgi:hypothetical protein